MSFNYADVKCPHCGDENRIPFVVKSYPFGSTWIEPDEQPRQCFHCREYFYGTVEINYGARKLRRYEQMQMEKAKGEHV
jgi:phage terminase large subunit GpA-like protein